MVPRLLIRGKLQGTRHSLASFLPKANVRREICALIHMVSSMVNQQPMTYLSNPHCLANSKPNIVSIGRKGNARKESSARICMAKSKDREPLVQSKLDTMLQNLSLNLASFGQKGSAKRVSPARICTTRAMCKLPPCTKHHSDREATAYPVRPQLERQQARVLRHQLQ